MAVGPSTLVGVVPWLLTRWEVRHPVPGGMPARVLGALLVGSGAVVLTHCFVRFVTEGVGTPAPIAPPQNLVVGGLYRHVRNPMYLAMAAAVAGQALLLGQPKLLLYPVIAAVPVASFVRLYEEPTLTRRFAAAYEEYRRNVPAWLPRLRPWRPTSPPSVIGRLARARARSERACRARPAAWPARPRCAPPSNRPGSGRDARSR
jgi:protein-S-isoprenylcysteine O-methyltransferase Ste14